MAYGSITVQATATKIVAADNNRHSLLLHNNGTQTVFIGPDASVTTSNGFPITQKSSLSSDSGGVSLFKGDIYGIVASSTADMRYWERVLGR